MINRVNTVHIALASDRRYLPGLKATLVSMIIAAKEKAALRFHIFTDSNQEELQLLAKRFGYTEDIDFRDSNLEILKNRFNKYNDSHVACLRLLLPELMNDIDWIIWSDVDTIWLRDPAELWSQRDDDYSILWSRDLPSIAHDIKQYSVWNPLMDERKYGCSGVVLMNLNKLRKTSFVDQCFEFVKKWGSPPFPDQDILNYLCYDNAKFVDDRWDLLNPNRNYQDGVVLHFNGCGKYFNDKEYDGWRPLYEIWFRYYRQVIEGRTNESIWPIWKRWMFNLIGFAYLPRWVFAWLPICGQRIDGLHRTQFFAWLRQKSLWSPIK